MTNKPISEVIAEIQRLLSSIEKYQRQGKVGEWVEEYRIATCPAELRRVLDHIAALEQQRETMHSIEYVQSIISLSAEWERKAISNFEECAQMSQRITELEQQLAAERARVVKLPLKSNAGDFFQNAEVYDAEEVVEAIRAAGIPVEGE